MTKVWYQTRYALTKGIVEVSNWEYTNEGRYIRHPGHLDRVNYDIFDNLQSAKDDQGYRARKAIAAAKKKIAKLEKLILESGGSIDG